MDEKEYKLLVKCALISAPVTVTARSLFRDIFNIAGVEIPYKELGFTSFLDYLCSIRDICEVCGNNQNAVILPVVTDTTAKINHLVCNNISRVENRGVQRYGGVYKLNHKNAEGDTDYENETESPDGCDKNIPKLLRHKIRNLMKENARGIWQCYFFNKFKVKYEYDLNIHQFGYSTLLHFVGQMPDIIKVLRPGGIKGDIIYFYSEGNIPDPDTLPMWPKIYPCKKIMEPRPKESIEFNLPEDTVSPYFTLSKQWVSSNVKVEDSILIRVTAVDDLDNIYVQLVRQQARINSLHDFMSNHYNKQPDYFKFPSHWIRLGMMCAVGYPTKINYYRAKILNIRDDKTAEVLLIDVGLRVMVQIEDLRLLSKDYIDMTEQAIRVCLYNMPNKDITWKSKAASYLLKATQDKFLHAKIRHINIKDKELTVEFIDRTCDPHVNINNLLMFGNLVDRNKYFKLNNNK